MKPQFGIFTTDAHLVITTWDPWLEKVTSRSAADICGKPLIEAFPEIETRGLSVSFRRALEQGAVELLAPALHGYLIGCPPRDESKFRQMQQRVVIAPLRKGEAITGLVVTVEDVTARRDDEREGVGALAAEHWRTRRQSVARVLEDAAETPITELIHRLRNEHRDPSVLNSILRLLTSGAWEALHPLLELTSDDDAEVRMYAALALGELKDRRAIPAVLRLLKDADVNVQYHAIEALANLRASEAVDALADIAESGEFFLAFPALDALADIGEPSVAARLVPLLGDETLRTAAIGALSQLGDHAVVGPLAMMLDQPRLVAVVAEALTTLHRRYEDEFGEGDYIMELAARQISAAGAQNLLNSLNSTSGEALRRVVRILGWIESEPVVDGLTRLLSSSSLRSEVIEALVRHGQRVTTPLCLRLESEDPGTRAAAVIALGRIGDPACVPALIAALPVPELTVEAARALARIGDARAYQPLLELLSHRQAIVRLAAVGALNSIGHPQMPEDVRRLLVDPDPHVRESAVRIAGYFGYAECAALVLDRLHDVDENVRRAAVESLPNLQDERVFPLLRTAIRDDSAKIRTAAVQSLAHLECAAYVPELMQAMSDSDAWVRYYAARALGQIRSPESMDALATALRQDEATQVRIAAAGALGAIGGRRAVSILAPFLNSEDSDLGRAALLALGIVGHPDALEPILGALRSEDPSRRLDAVRAIASRRDNEAVDALQWTAAADASETVAEAAIEELSRMATSESIAALLRLTADRRLREKSLVEISRLGPKHLDRIKEGLSNPQIETRRAVVDALGRIKHPGASQALMTALDDERPEIRLAALLALKRLGSFVSERKLWTMAHGDSDPGVRKAAEEALQR